MEFFDQSDIARLHQAALQKNINLPIVIKRFRTMRDDVLLNAENDVTTASSEQERQSAQERLDTLRGDTRTPLIHEICRRFVYNMAQCLPRNARKPVQVMQYVHTEGANVLRHTSRVTHISSGELGDVIRNMFIDVITSTRGGEFCSDLLKKYQYQRNGEIMEACKQVKQDLREHVAKYL